MDFSVLNPYSPNYPSNPFFCVFWVDLIGFCGLTQPMYTPIFLSHHQSITFVILFSLFLFLSLMVDWILGVYELFFQPQWSLMDNYFLMITFKIISLKKKLSKSFAPCNFIFECQIYYYKFYIEYGKSTK